MTQPEISDLVNQAAEAAATRALEKAVGADHVCRLSHISAEDHKRHHEAFERFMAVMAQLDGIRWGVVKALAIAGTLFLVGLAAKGFIAWLLGAMGIIKHG